jgi:leucyl aminopeptidase (aminopeptidase T)
LRLHLGKWRNGSVTYHKVKVLDPRCPQKMLKFYESHLQFRYTAQVQYSPAAEKDPDTKEAVKATSNTMASTNQKSATSIQSIIKDAVTWNTLKAATPKAVATKASTPACAAVKSVQ